MRGKLIYPSTAIVPSTQANSIQIMKMCSGLSRFGFDVTLLAGTVPRHRNIDVFQYYGLENTFSIVRRLTGCHRGSSFLLSMRFYPVLRRLAATAQDTFFYGRDVLALHFLARAGRQVIYETHDTAGKGPRSWAEEKLVNSEHLCRIVFISNELKNVYLEKYGSLLINKKMIVAPDAADEQPNFHETINLRGDADFAACYIGSFLKGRGIELILDVARRMPDVGFHLFGGTNDQISRLGQKISRNVHFYGYVTPAQTYKARNAADVLLMPYQKEVMVAQDSSETSRWMSPVKLFEYMSAKKPIVSSNHRVLQEVLEDGRNCLLCEPDDAEQWVRAITSVKHDEQLYGSLSETAYRDFVDKYTWDKRVQHVLAEGHAVLEK
jgi:glycosyltransferase involved in cell wall biosynthesis